MILPVGFDATAPWLSLNALPTERSEVVASKKQLITVFYAAKPPKARSRRTQAVPATHGDYATVEIRAHDC